MELRAGQKLFSGVCDAQFVVVRAPDHPVEVACGGAPVLDAAPAAAGGSVDLPGDGVKVGKRYVDEESNLELLCSKAGDGALTVDGRPAGLKGAKPLPASD